MMLLEVKILHLCEMNEKETKKGKEHKKINKE